MNRFHCAAPLRTLASFTTLTLLTLSAATAQVATGTTGIDASGNYRQEVRTCGVDMPRAERATCLREARNALAEKRRGALGNSGAHFEANAMARCDVHANDERLACQARVREQGTTSGSVAGGGVLREVETVVTPAPSMPR